MTDATVDDLGGFSAGYTGKLFGAARVKYLGGMSMGTILNVLGVKMLLIPDLEALKAWAERRPKRERPTVNAQRRASIGKHTIRRVLPDVMSEMGKRGAAVANHKRTAKQRSSSARKAARARWKKPRRKSTRAAAQTSAPFFFKSRVARFAPINCGKLNPVADKLPSGAGESRNL
jgi:hypothetical protein